LPPFYRENNGGPERLSNLLGNQSGSSPLFSSTILLASKTKVTPQGMYGNYISICIHFEQEERRFQKIRKRILGISYSRSRVLFLKAEKVPSILEYNVPIFLYIWLRILECGE